METELFAEIVACVAKSKQVWALDLGCGNGTTSLKMARAGARVVAIDLSPTLPQDIADQVAAYGVSAEAIIPIVGDYRNVIRDREGKSGLAQTNDARFDFVLANRTFNHIPYPDMSALLGTLSDDMMNGHAKFYLSSATIDSAYGNGYSARGLPVEQRYTPLARDVAEKFNIGDKFFLGTADEIIIAFKQVGLSIVSHDESVFGSVKLITEKIPNSWTANLNRV